MSKIWVLGAETGELSHAHYRDRLDEIEADYYLSKNSTDNWQLCDKQQRHQALTIDFASPYYRYRGGKEWLPKALKGLHGASVADLTAGWARDSWLLAYRGFDITLYERNPYLQILLRQALAQAQHNPAIATIAARLRLVEADAITALNQAYDVTYLDPMYPPKRKNAKVKKDMQALQQLLANEENDDSALLTTALKHSHKRTIVKRPKNAPHLGKQAPSHSLNAPNTRYDIYLPTQNNS